MPPCRLALLSFSEQRYWSDVSCFFSDFPGIWMGMKTSGLRIRQPLSSDFRHKTQTISSDLAYSLLSCPKSKVEVSPYLCVGKPSSLQPELIGSLETHCSLPPTTHKQWKVGPAVSFPQDTTKQFWKWGYGSTFCLCLLCNL